MLQTGSIHRDEMEQAPVRLLLTGYWPLVLFFAYLTFTVVLFAVGPIDYPVASPWKVYTFLAASHLALVGGYLAGQLYSLRRPASTAREWVPSVSTLTVISSTLNIVLLIPATLFMTEGSFNLLTALKNPSAAYARTLRIAESTTNPFVYAILLVAPILFLTVPLALFYWRQLTTTCRCLAATAIIVIWAAGVLLGRNKGLADLFLLALVFFLVHVARTRWQSGDLRRWLFRAALVAALFALFFGLFMSGAVGRMPYTYTQGYVRVIDGYMDYDNAFLRPFPEAIKPGVGYLYNYLTQGYYGLSQTMELDFVWTRGFGNSYFLHMVEERILGTTYAKSNCYPARAEDRSGYSMYGSWHTIYPWIASDLTFLGAVLFVFVVGSLLAVTWRETLIGRNPLSVAMFATLCLMIFYFPANNQLLGFPVQFSSTVGLTALWLLSRKRSAGD